MFSCTYIMCIAISSILCFSHLLCHERLCILMLCIRDGEFGGHETLVSSFYMESLWCVVAASFLSVNFFCNAEHFCLHGGLSLYGELHLMSQFVHFCCFTKPNCHVSLSIWRLQDPLHRFSGAN